MRHLTIVSGIFALVATLFFASCQKQALYSPSVVATIDSIPFIANGSAAVTCDSSGSGSVVITAHSYVIAPGTATQPVMTLLVPRQVGTYTVNQGCSATITTWKTGTSGTAAASGTITVMGIVSGRIEGNFSFTCANGQTVTKGQFYCALPQ